MPRRWALITGASSGIGRALARRAAQDGYNVIAVARDEARLQALAAQCRERHGVEARVLVQDLSLPESVSNTGTWLKRQGITTDLLVNNAGFGVHGMFSETEEAREQALIAVSINAVVGLTKLVLPSMIENGSGRILNVGSVYCFAPVPHQAVYAASKAFLLSFSQSLAEELKGSGVFVTLLAPGITRTEFRARAGISDSGRLSGMEPAAVAEAAFKVLAKGELIVIPGMTNKIFAALAGHIPASLQAALVGKINSARGLKRKKENAASPRGEAAL